MKYLSVTLHGDEEIAELRFFRDSRRYLYLVGKRFKKYPKKPGDIITVNRDNYEITGYDGYSVCNRSLRYAYQVKPCNGEKTESQRVITRISEYVAELTPLNF